MNITGLDNKEYKWKLSSSTRSRESKSGLHNKARLLLKKIFPFDVIHEDITLPGTKTRNRKSLLYADFFLPNRRLIVEVNGEQHHKHIAFFHENLHDFYRASLRDKDKANWCLLNEITLVNLEYNEVEKWEQKIMER